MRILQAHNRHGSRGGADAVIDREHELLTRSGHDVAQFFTPPSDERSDRSWRNAAASVWNVEATRGLGEAIERFRPAVVHVHTPFPLMSPAIFRAAHRHGVPTVSTVHSYRYSCIAATLRRDGRLCEDCVGKTLKLPAVRHRCYHDNRPASAAMAASLTLHHSIGTFRRHVDTFLTLTEFSRQILLREGLAADQVSVKPNFVEDPGPTMPYDERTPTVLFVGRLVDEKGIRTLLAAWKKASRVGVRLIICGDGPLRTVVQQAAAQDSTIEFAGWLPGEVIIAAQKSAKMTVVPSEWYEAGPPLVLLDALACGTPLVTSDLENISRTVVETGAGLTFHMGDTDSLAKALCAMLEDPDAAARMGSAARGLYERDHTARASLAALESTYRRVTAPVTG